MLLSPIRSYDNCITILFCIGTACNILAADTNTNPTLTPTQFGNPPRPPTPSPPPPPPPVPQTSFHHPREENGRNCTTGEKAWRANMKMAAKNAARRIWDEHRTKRRSAASSTTMQTPTTHPNHQPIKTKHKQKHKQSKQSPLSPNLQSEYQPLSSPHGIHSTITSSTPIDANTLAHIRTSAAADDKNPSSPDAAHLLGLIYLHGLAGLNPDASRAAHWFRTAALANHADAQCALGLLYYHGIVKDGENKNNHDSGGGNGKAVVIIGRDVKAAMLWFYRASVDSSHPRGHWLLGRCLYEGMTYGDIGVTVGRGNDTGDGSNESTRLEEAARLFRLAAEADISEAIHHLALMYEYGLISDDDDNNDIDRDRDGHNHTPKTPQSPQSQQQSQTKTPNFQKAAKLYHRATKLNNPESAYNLGLMYAQGRGVSPDDTRAVEYFRKGALSSSSSTSLHPHAPSMRYLGLFAASGRGQPNDVPDYDMGLYWLEQCAKWGHGGGQRRDDEYGGDGYDSNGRVMISSSIMDGYWFHSGENDGDGGVGDICNREWKELQVAVDTARAHRKQMLRNSTDDESRAASDHYVFGS